MTDKEKMYELMGELLYAMAKADGVIQNEESEALNELLKDHPWSSNIMWSFNYEAKKGRSVAEMYDKVIYFCKNHGPSPEYIEFIEAMKIVAAASNGIEKSESKIIESFSNDLLERFNQDIERNSL